MKKIILILFVVCCYPLYAQQGNGNSIKVVYKELYTPIDNVKMISQDRMCLFINGKCSEFYSQWYSEYCRALDSLTSIGCSLLQIGEKTSSYHKNKQRYRVLKNYPHDGFITYANDLLSLKLFYTEKNEIPKWNILPKKKVILGYTCQEAETYFYGRKWVAWFTSEIPLQDGPWKLCGLPGLILAANDITGHYVFECVGIENVNKPTKISLPKGHYIKSTKEKNFEMEKLFVENLDEFFFRVTGQRGQSFEADGKPMHRVYVYNPIELK